MSTSKRNLVYPIVVISVGALMLLLAVGLVPNAVGDILERSWAATLILLGLNMLLADRVRFGNWIALVIVMVGLFAIIQRSYNTRAEIPISDVQLADNIEIGDHLERLEIKVQTLNASVNFFPAPESQRILSFDYAGTKESQIRVSAQEEDNVVRFSLIEETFESLPSLENYGRGELNIYLPAGISLDVDFKNEMGLASLDFRVLDVPRLNLQNDGGDIDLYMPLQGIVIGDVASQNGNLRIIVSPEISIRINSAARAVEYDQNVYFIEQDVIETRGGLLEFQFRINASAPSGTLTIQTAEGR